MKIKILNRKKFKTKKEIKLHDFDFSIYKNIIGNKLYLDYIFDITKNQLISDGQKS